MTYELSAMLHTWRMDVRAPSHQRGDSAGPGLVGTYNTTGDAWDVVVTGNKAFVADGDAGLVVIDVTNPVTPTLLGTINPPGIQKGVDVDPGRQLAVLASGTSGIHVVNIANPAAPVQLSALPGGDVRDVALQGTFALLADGSRSFTSVDLTNPAAPILGASTAQSLGGLLNDVAVQGNFALGADVFFVNGVPIINIDAPATPVVRALLNFSSFRDDDGQGIAADGGYVYLTAVLGSAFTENGATGNSRLYIGQYIALQDLGGVAPTVAITEPMAGRRQLREVPFRFGSPRMTISQLLRSRSWSTGSQPQPILPSRTKPF